MTKKEYALFSTIPKGYRWFFWLSFIIMAVVFLFSITIFIVKPATVAEKNYPKYQILSESEDYAFSFDVTTKNPVWAMEVVKKDNAGSKTRSLEKKIDRNISTEFLPKMEDYLGSGFDPVSLFASSELQSLLPASSPQAPALAKHWAQFNDYARSLPEKLNVDRILVVTEPLYLPEEGVKTISYDLISEDSIAVPTHFFRAIFYSLPSQGSVFEAEKYNAFPIPSITAPVPPRPFPPLVKLNGEAFLIPNQDIEEGTALDSFRVQSWEEIKKIPGVILPEDLKVFVESW